MGSNNAIVLLGSNIGNKYTYIDEARQKVSKFIGEIKRQSAVIETPAWPCEDDEPYLNQLLHIESELNPFQAIRNIMNIELSMGRVRGMKNSPRIIDIDIIEWSDLVLSTGILVLPHPALGTREYLDTLYKSWL